MVADNQCCLQAAREHKNGHLTHELYIQHLFSHCADPKPENPILDDGFWDRRQVDLQIENVDPFAYAVRCFVSDYTVSSITHHIVWNINKN